MLSFLIIGHQHRCWPNFERTLWLFRNGTDPESRLWTMSSDLNWTWFPNANGLKLKLSINPYPRFLGLSPSVISGKKSIIITGDVTVKTNKIKIICAGRVSVELFYGINFKWHMPICEEICRAEQKYMPFFGTVTERDFRKKSKPNIQMTKRCALDFFSMTVPHFGFFSGFTDKG